MPVKRFYSSSVGALAFACLTLVSGVRAEGIALDLDRPPAADPASPPANAPGSAPAPPAGAAPGTPSVLAGAPASVAPASGARPPGSARIEPPTDVDETGLRYYASLNQKTRVEAETRRLRALYPGWNPPSDLYSTSIAGSPEDQPLWDLFATDRLDDLRSAVEARLASDPGWVPPPDLMAKFRRKLARRKVLTLSSSKQFKELSALVKEDPSLLEAADAEVLWSIAEGYALSKQTTEATTIYKTLLTTDTDSGERLATVQKAMGVLRMNDVESLVALGRRGADGGSEFDVILTDLTRARIAAYLHDERIEEVPPGDVKLFENYAREATDPDQPGLVAWYRYKRKEFSEALEWFKYALARGGDAKIAHGLAHSLRELGKFREAEEVAYAWRDYDIGNMILFIDLLEIDLTKPIPPYIENDRLDRYGQVTAETASGEGAQALAWYAYNSCQYFTALEWFERANAWLPKEATAYGLALTLRRLKERRRFVEIVNRYDRLFPKVIELIFPDEGYRPPTPCEQTVLPPPANAMASMGQYGATWQPAGLATSQQNGQSAFAGAATTAYTAELAYAYPPGTAPDYPGSIHDPLRRYSWGQVPSPTGAPYRQVAAAYHGEPFRAVRFNPAEFPVSVPPENPLRFLAMLKPSVTQPPSAAVPPVLSAFGREAFPGPWPNVARKVPGVAPMAYEKQGFQQRLANACINQETGPLLLQPPGRPAVVGPIRQAGPETIAPPLNGQGCQPLPGTVALKGQPQPSAGPSRGAEPAPAPPAAVPGFTAPVAYAQPMATVYAAPVASPVAAGQAPVAPVALPQYGAQQTYAPQAYAPQTYAPQMGTVLQQSAPPQSFAPQSLSPEADEPSRRGAVQRRPRRVQQRVELRSEPRVEALAPAPAARGGGACAAALNEATLGQDLAPAEAVRRGWCLLNSDRPREAALAFERGLAGSGKTREDAAYGKSLANIRTSTTNTAAMAANEAQLSPERRNDIGTMVLAQRAVNFYNTGHYPETLAVLDQRLPYAVEPRYLTLLRGWSLYHMSKLDQSARIFRALDQQVSTKESREGLAAIESKGIGRFN